MTMSSVGRAAVGGLALLSALATVATPAAAQRRHGNGSNGAGIAAGVIGGLAAGAIIGGVVGGPARGGFVDDGAGAYDPAYAEGGEVEGGCPVVRQPVYDRAGRLAGYQNVQDC